MTSSFKLLCSTFMILLLSIWLADSDFYVAKQRRFEFKHKNWLINWLINWLTDWLNYIFCLGGYVEEQRTLEDPRLLDAAETLGFRSSFFSTFKALFTGFVCKIKLDIWRKLETKWIYVLCVKCVSCLFQTIN